MTENEWMECAVLDSMLWFLPVKASDRKRRLLATAACRLIWHLISDTCSRQAVDVAERFADGMATEEERAEAEEVSRIVAEAAFDRWNEELIEVAEAGIGYWAAVSANGTVSLVQRKNEEVVSNAGMALAWSEDGELAAGPDYWAGIELNGPWPSLIREMFGNPFRAVPLDPSWLAWHDGKLRQLAQAMYNESAFDRLPILADALEEAGCTDAEILNHCRLPGEHVRGCWVVDLILGKS